MLEVWSWRKGKVHEVGDGGLAFAAVEWSHGSSLGHRIVVCQLGSSVSFMCFPEGLLISRLRGMTRCKARHKRNVAAFVGGVDVIR
jgi:hypothetical protein